MKKITFFLSMMLSLLSALTANAQHEYVDLGLPSGTLWATCNVGANSPEEFGDYFAWGETATKADYSWSGYKHANGSGSALTRYCTNNSYGTVDGKTVLGQTDDAAEANWDNTWQMPSMEQFRELLNDEYTTAKKTFQNDVYGMLITGKKNGKSIFLPAAGIRMETELYNDGSRAYFWSHDLNTGSNDKALDFNFDTRNMSLTDTQARCYGLSIRPVRKIEHDYVDLGLPSGTLWATCNVGAKNPADYGGYFAWGETTTKSDYSWGTYKWMNPGQASLEQINKYTIADGNTGACWYDSNGQFIGDNKTTLVPADDAATINWGDDWQMPSKEQLRELINSDYTTSTWAAQTRSDGLLNYGILITSKKNGNSIFLPAAGFHDGTRVVLEDYETRYWSTHLGYHTSGWAFSEWFASRNENETTPKYQSTSDGDPRYLGQCIRPVRAEPQPEVYTEFVEATGTLTYYYDNKRESRSGVTEVYDPINNLKTKRFEGYAEKVLKGVIDPSMKQAPLTSMREMFFGRDRNYLTAMTTVEGLGNLNTSIVTDMSHMFVACEALTTLDLSSFNTQSVVNISYMFLGCSSLTTLDLSTFNTEKVTNMESMFNGCRSLSMLNLSSFNTKNVTDMEATFCFCSSLTTLDLSSFNAQNVTNTRGMFYYCKLLTELDLNSFNVQNVEDLETMFTGCESLTTIYCDNDWSSIGAQSEYMFKGCTALVGGRGTTYNAAFVDATYARPDGGTSAPGYFTLSSDKQPEVYTEFVEATGTLTYYYDNQRAKRTGITELYDPVKDPYAVRFYNYFDKVLKAVIDPSMKEARLTSTRNMFYGDWGGDIYCLGNMTTIEGLENLNTESVTDMSQMFYLCHSLTTLDLSSFNTENVTTMAHMFTQCHSLTTLDLSSFNTENVTSMSLMFSDCESLTTLDVTSFNTQNVVYMDYMFYRCENLQTIDISSFNISSETYFDHMFFACSKLKTIYCDKDWSSSTNSASCYMFSNCVALVGGKGTRYDEAYTDATYARPDGGTSAPGYFTLSSENPEFYVEFVRSTGTLTYYYDEKRATRTGLTGNGYLGDYWAMNALDFDPNSVRKAVIDPSMKEAPLTSTASMFSTMSNLTAIEGLENLNTANVTDMSDMFLECQKLASLDLSSFNTANVKTVDRMFNGCSALESLDLSSFNTANVKTMDRIFNGCSALESLDLSSFNTANVPNMGYMFADCKSLTSLDLSSFNTANVENMEAMFYNCMALPSIDVSSFNTANVTNMSWMFNSCSSLTTIWCDKDWSASPKLESSRSMFGECSALVGGEGTRYDEAYTDATYARPDGGTERPGYFTEKPSRQGDLNGDKKVDIADAVTVLNIMAASEFKAEADLNGDQKIDIADFVTVLNIMAAQ